MNKGTGRNGNDLAPAHRRAGEVWNEVRKVDFVPRGCPPGAVGGQAQDHAAPSEASDRGWMWPLRSRRKPAPRDERTASSSATIAHATSSGPSAPTSRPAGA